MIFRWEPPTYQRSAAICDVPGVGRLYARRAHAHARTFRGSINGEFTGYYTSLDAAKAHLETLAASWKPDGSAG